MIDTHCHFDMMPDPECYIRQREKCGDIVIGMTNLPSYFEIGFHHISGYRHVRLALGFHPLLVDDHKTEWSKFLKNLNRTSYIGEIGLDFSKEGVMTKDAQIQMFQKILSKLKGQKKILSVHSRKAEAEVLALLKEYDIKNVIFHWYTGKTSLIPDIISHGYYFSVNEAMCTTTSGQKVISLIPNDRILTESDAPFNFKANVLNTYNYLEKLDCSSTQIYENFKRLVDRIR